MAITIFSSPRPFTDPHTSMIQRNAIESWLQLRPQPQVLLIGDDQGVGDVARELNVTHVPEVATTDYGMPMRDSMHELAHRYARHDLVCVINADIIVLSNFYECIRRIPFKWYVATGRRFDVDVSWSIRFESDSWREELEDLRARSGVLHGPSAVDYAVYPKAIDPPILPPFPMHLPGWDGWFLCQYKRQRIPVVNLDTAVTVLHQNHESAESIHDKVRIWQRDEEARNVLRRSGGFSNRATLREADFVFADGDVRRPTGIYAVLSRMVRFKPYRLALGAKRWLEFMT